jgi:capsular exopolysaccharide synthesis family protein
VTLKDVVEILWRRQRRVFIAVFVAAMAVVALITFTLPKVYETSATLFVGENRPISSAAEAVQLDEVLAASYAELLGTTEMERKVADALPFELDPDELEGKVSFGVITGTRLVEIVASDGDPARAQEIANTYAETFVSDRLERVEKTDDEQLSALNEQIAALASEIEALRVSSSADAPGRLAQAENELDAFEDAYRDALLNARLAASNVSVSSSAAEPESVARPKPRLYLAIGAVLAFVLATAAALIRNAFDVRVEHEAEILRSLEAPLLARIPRLGQSADSARAYRDAIHFLRVNLEQFAPPEGSRAIAITSAAPNEGKTTIVRDLAGALAMTGSTAVAVDCDLRKPKLASSLDLPFGPGLTDVLLGREPASDVLQQTRGEHGFRVLSAGSTGFDPVVLLDGPGLTEVISQLRDEARWILIDTPPVLAGAETSSIFQAVDGVIVVADAQSSRRDQLRVTRQQLSSAGARVLGVVLNRLDTRQDAYYHPGRTDAGEDSADKGNGAELRRRTRRPRRPARTS